MSEISTGLELEETETNHGKQNLDFVRRGCAFVCRHAIRMSAAARRRSRNDVDLQVQDWDLWRHLPRFIST
jgi:hypothetical protein